MIILVSFLVSVIFYLSFYLVTMSPSRLLMIDFLEKLIDSSFFGCVADSFHASAREPAELPRGRETEGEGGAGERRGRGTEYGVVLLRARTR